MKRYLTLLIVSLFLLVVIPNYSHAKYYTGIGARFSIPYHGISVKRFFDATNTNAAEGILSYSPAESGVILCALFEHHISLSRAYAFSLYFGGGVHSGYYFYQTSSVENYRKREDNNDPYRENILTFGVDGVLGLEYILPFAPISLSVDFKPIYDLLNPTKEWKHVGVGVRYTL